MKFWLKFFKKSTVLRKKGFTKKASSLKLNHFWNNWWKNFHLHYSVYGNVSSMSMRKIRFFLEPHKNSSVLRYFSGLNPWYSHSYFGQKMNYWRSGLRKQLSCFELLDSQTLIWLSFLLPADSLYLANWLPYSLLEYQGWLDNYRLSNNQNLLDSFFLQV